MTSRIPHLLEPYLSLPDEAALVVLTGVLGASTNWLVLRHLHALLKPQSPPSSSSITASTPPVTGNEARNGGSGGGEGAGEAGVLLVSFLRDFAFWKENLSRLGVDLEAAARRGRFGYVDGLSGLFTPSPAQGQLPQQARQGWRRVLTSPAAGEITRVVLEGVEQLRRGSSTPAVASGTGETGERKVVVVVDGLDLVLAASSSMSPNPGAGQQAGATAMAIKDMLMDLREKTHAAIVTLAVDDPLIKEQETPLEKQHAWFALSLAHEADTVLSLRLLDTGTAKDVSGVIRITHGGARTKDHEYLYHVGGDGGVRVFERGQ